MIGLAHDSLDNYYQVNFAMMQHHNYSLTELDSMVPWERDIYVALLMRHLAEEKQRMESQKQERY